MRLAARKTRKDVVTKQVYVSSQVSIAIVYCLPFTPVWVIKQRIVVGCVCRLRQLYSTSVIFVLIYF